MTVSTTESRIGYNGNGATTVFAFPYRFLTNTDLVVTLVQADTTQVVQTLNTDYTVTGAGDDAGGTVTMVVPPATGQQLVIVRDVPLTQETDYISGDPFPAETHERALDKLTMISQRLESLISRSIRLSDADLLVTSTILPAPSPGSSLIWNLTGTGLVNGVSSGSFVGLSPYMEVVLGSVDAAEALTNLTAAADAEVVKLTGAQTIAGVKTFSSSPIVPTPTTDFQASTKAYADTVATTLVNAAVSPPTIVPTIFVEGALQSLSGFAGVQFNSIPTWVKHIILLFRNASGSSTGRMYCRIGQGTSPVATGYSGTVTITATGTTVASSPAGFSVHPSAAAAEIYSGRFDLYKFPGNTWMGSFVGERDGGTGTYSSHGLITLAGELGCVELAIASGTFDGGWVQALWE